jgi:hypothetical protein
MFATKGGENPLTEEKNAGKRGGKEEEGRERGREGGRAMNVSMRTWALSRFFS